MIFTTLDMQMKWQIFVYSFLKLFYDPTSDTILDSRILQADVTANTKTSLYCVKFRSKYKN